MSAFDLARELSDEVPIHIPNLTYTEINLTILKHG